MARQKAVENFKLDYTVTNGITKPTKILETRTYIMHPRYSLIKALPPGPIAVTGRKHYVNSYFSNQVMETCIL